MVALCSVLHSEDCVPQPLFAGRVDVTGAKHAVCIHSCIGSSFAININTLVDSTECFRQRMIRFGPFTIGFRTISVMPL